MVQENKARFLELLKTVNRTGIDNLINYLENKSDFFTAPASAKYHLSIEGGLCQHCLNVYDNMCKLRELFKLDGITDESLIIVALLHDLGKVNFYEKTVRNEKVYDPAGTKYDNLGNYEWFAVESYKIKEPEDRFLGSGHAVNAILLASQFIPLRLSEQTAIINHHGALDPYVPPVKELGFIYGKYPLATLLHMADVGSTFFTENELLNE